MKRRPATLWIAAGLSLGLHGLAVACFFQVPGPRPQHQRPLIVETITLRDDEPLTLTLTLPDEPRQEIAPEPAGTRAGPPAPAPAATVRSAEPGTPTTSAHAPGGRAAPGTTSGGGQPRGGPGTTFFHVATRARSVVYVLDRSVSMGLNGTLDAVKHELIHSLSGLPGEARFQVLFYNRHVEPLRIGVDSGLHPATAANVARLTQQLTAIRAEGGTDHLPALRAALALGPEAIYLLTDAADLGPDTLRAITQLNRGSTSIHTIELVRGRQYDPTHSALYRLAQTNRGTYQALAVKD